MDTAAIVDELVVDALGVIRANRLHIGISRGLGIWPSLGILAIALRDQGRFVRNGRRSGFFVCIRLGLLRREEGARVEPVATDT